MKTKILFLALFFFILTLESSANSQNVVVTDSGGKVMIWHKKGNGDYIQINVSKKAIPAHLLHGDSLTDPSTGGGGGGPCIPPAC